MTFVLNRIYYLIYYTNQPSSSNWITSPQFFGVNKDPKSLKPHLEVVASRFHPSTPSWYPLKLRRIEKKQDLRKKWAAMPCSSQQTFPLSQEILLLPPISPSWRANSCRITQQREMGRGTRVFRWSAQDLSSFTKSFRYLKWRIP